MKNILFVLAHCDDEFFFSHWIEFHIRKKNNVLVVYTTDSGAGGGSQAVRKLESLKSLKYLGVDAKQVLFLGADHSIPDGKSYLLLPKIFEILQLNYSSISIHEIYALAWEGGHPDHDTAHLAARLMAFSHLSAESATLYECPAYNGFEISSPFFRVMKPIETFSCDVVNLSLINGFRLFSLIFQYRSQIKTWLGLGPFAFIHLVLIRKFRRRKISDLKTVSRPHEGQLLYERMFGVPYDSFALTISDFTSLC